jgi:hypothetical protein
MSAMELESAARPEKEAAVQAKRTMSAVELLLRWQGRVFEWIMFGLLRSTASIQATNDSYHCGCAGIKLACAAAGNQYFARKARKLRWRN